MNFFLAALFLVFILSSSNFQNKRKNLSMESQDKKKLKNGQTSSSDEYLNENKHDDDKSKIINDSNTIFKIDHIYQEVYALKETLNNKQRRYSNASTISYEDKIKKNKK
ncbi:hypothetical protein GVAV_000656 [Gurleya vavrai]